jgi:serine/threonine protein kinase/peptidoglycan hydrolase-like protein with peptidoglycan-binding domain
MAEAGASRWENLPGDMRGVLPAGTSLRGYELVSILGQGAFGITYRARDLQLHRDVAIKEYLPTSLALREGRTTVVPRSAEHAEQFAWGRERFMEEARTLARLDRTPAIVRVHDFLEDNGTAYMVMALIEGETLARRLACEKRLPPDAVERIVFPLLDGLEEVHGIGFLHRDIKPANVMIDAHGRPTLIDFGASRAAMAERSTTLTAIFTPGYAAAEQFTSAKLGPWSDIYGLAATLYNVVTGNIPPSAIERILKDTYEPLSTLQPEGFPPGLLAGIDAGLAIRVEDRPQTIAEWRHMLRSDGYGASSAEATRIGRRPSRLARAAGRTRRARLTLKGPALWGAAAAVILLVMGGGYLAMMSGSPGTSVASLSAEQLEQALAERRKADTLAAEKRRLEEEARQKAVAEAGAQRQAQAELEQARQAREKAEQELAELRARIAAGPARPGQQDPASLAAQRAAEVEAQRKAEAEAAAMRQAEEEAQKKLETEAEARRQADEAVARLEAERRQAEQQARARAEAEQAALKQASEEAQRKAADAESVRQAEVARAVAEAEQNKAAAERRKAEDDARLKAEAEAAEKALRLDQMDRKRLQVALTSLGFDTRGTDGLFGSRSREMIAAWQAKAGAPATGFLTSAQRDQVLRAAAPAVARWDDEQKKLGDEKGKANEQKKVEEGDPRPAANQAAALTTSAPVAAETSTAPTKARTSLSVAPGSHPNCGAAMMMASFGSFPITIHSNRIEARLPWGWEAATVGPDGTFSAEFTSPPQGFGFGNTFSTGRMSLRGNVKSKEVRLERLAPGGPAICIWTGTFS